MLKYSQTIRAPEIPKHLEWLNTAHPLRLAELRGKVVLLDFWTHCCINCQHVLPKLADLEKRYGNALVVIGVHSAKFRDEGASNNITQAILRHNIKHPVVNDRQFELWQEYAIRAWPTLVLIDPDGYIVVTQSGESAPEAIDTHIASLIQNFAAQDKLDRNPTTNSLPRHTSSPSFLEFPSKVLVDNLRERLFIADSNHNRIIVADRHSGEIETIIGSGKTGLLDGRFDQAQFNHPQGMDLVDDTLFVADTRNHVLRAADLVTGDVRTVAGTGELGSNGHGSGNALDTPLASPWDVIWNENRLYIAMAGLHQIWYYNPATQEIGVLAGNGHEDLVDGSSLLAALAQPSGMACDEQGRLFVVDSETSAIRALKKIDGNPVSTIIGHGLFEFGDVDGDHVNARLQHPLGIAHHNGLLYVADTYNNKIKQIDPVRRTSVSWAGSGICGLKDGSRKIAQFNEPGGIDVADDGVVYVADTNNHAIRVIDPNSGQVSSFTFLDQKVASQ